MAKAERADIGKPQLRPEDLGDADASSGTIESVEYRGSEFGGKRYVLQFKEFKSRELWVNKTGQNGLIDHLGDDTDRWVGKVAPLITVRVSVGGKTSHVVQIAVDEWDKVLKTVGAVSAATSRKK